MKAHQHASTNGLLGKPSGVSESECGPLPITRVNFTNVKVCFSFWRPSAEELALLNAGKSVRIGVWGTTQPPIDVGVDGDGSIPGVS